MYVFLVVLKRAKLFYFFVLVKSKAGLAHLLRQLTFDKNTLKENVNSSGFFNPGQGFNRGNMSFMDGKTKAEINR